MPRREVEVYTVSVTYDCDQCGEEMRTIATKTSNPPIYVLSCPNDHRANSAVAYPTIEYRPKEK